MEEVFTGRSYTLCYSQVHKIKCLLLKKILLYVRRYTKFYGTLGDAAADIAHDAILGNV